MPQIFFIAVVVLLVFLAAGAAELENNTYPRIAIGAFVVMFVSGWLS